jgi:hypothetical protein
MPQAANNLGKSLGGGSKPKLQESGDRKTISLGIDIDARKKVWYIPASPGK